MADTLSAIPVNSTYQFVIQRAAAVTHFFLPAWRQWHAGSACAVELNAPNFRNHFLSSFFTLWFGVAHLFFILKIKKLNKTIGCYIFISSGLLIAYLRQPEFQIRVC